MPTFFEFTVNDELKLQSWNPALAELGRRDGQELLGLDYYALLPRICQDRHDALALVLERGVPLDFPDYRFPCFAGGVRGDVHIEPVPFPGGGAGARVSIALQGCCEAVGSLRQSRHLADLGKTASMLSHGVRNPLNAIKGAVVYLKNRYGNDATLLEFTGIMEEEIDRLDRFIGSFLSASAVSFGRERHQVNALLRKLEQFVALQAQAADVTLRLDLTESLPEVDINVFQVEHAILNILNNAIHALPRGGGICVTSRCEACSARRCVVVSVQDDGPGISGSEGDFRQPRLASAVAEGRGFGLFLVREIMQQHGGFLEIRGGRDRGTTARLLFPVHGSDA
ncbi:two-component system sensor histidine kinase NtrB [Trichloromonas sp.]|uniref:two-component system sensor histidine kinase NtrB n=1 Tax=Trichloromonas sp. TaxID=3069249 RepID=UPI002A499238|nr:ATP-binding protein [Trichloromonas sp.]